MIINHRSDQLLSCDGHSIGHDFTSQHSDCEDYTDIEEVDVRDVQELQSLVNLFKDYPRDMCVQRIVREYASSESDHDRIRCQYFELLKQVNPDFSFNQNSELRHRVYTRSGESVAIRLAQDIHSKIEVIEGGDYSIIRNMISSGKARKSSVHRHHNKRAPAVRKKSERCQCAQEQAVIKETSTSFQASVLCIKQSLHISDNLRSEQINCI
ncbi:hypothetical protein DPMN_154488 [Dreissena polymorpha]|uniref:Uncharacterized protein n=1 Tax=Dreissena polymorpha TaxID=45954 RepID=A0A9D4FL70_DREPO|nr:hypothetical protein DPMN_154488 [Dreissena polymorpha]